jgi:hypothetical protein
MKRLLLIGLLAASYSYGRLSTRPEFKRQLLRSLLVFDGGLHRLIHTLSPAAIH